MRRISLLVLLASLTLGNAGTARAELKNFKITLEPGAGTQFAQGIGLDLTQLQSQIETEVKNAFQLYRIDDYLRSFADAQAFATKGLGADYASNIDYFMIGVAGNVALNADKAYLEGTGRGEPAVKGVTTNATIMAGVNLGLIGLRPLTLFGNYFKGKGSYREFSTDIDNYGAHLQLKLFGFGSGVLGAIIRWGGFDITTGFDYARQTMRLSDNKEINRSVAVGDPMYDAEVAIKAMGAFRLNLKTWTIPLELTTNIRLLELVSVYGGLGFDWQLGGDAEMNIDVNGNMTGSVPGQNIKDQPLGTASVTATGNTGPSKASLRGLVGAQVNILILKLFTQLNYSPELGTASVAFGARVAW